MKSKKNNSDLDIELTPDTGTKINWFPGHMVKAIREVQSRMKLCDIVLEIRDARVPLTSGNAKLHEVLGQKGRVIAINKTNLADPKIVAEWEEYFRNEKVPHIFCNSLDKKSLQQVVALAKSVIEERRQSSGGIREKKIQRMMIIGLPNTGKSTFINTLAGRKIARAQNRPGLTQCQQWVKIGDDIELLDTPGIMPPNIEREEQGFWLCAIYAIKDDIVGTDQVAWFVVDFLLKNNPDALKDFYKLESISDDANEVIERIALQRKFFLKGARPDLKRTYGVILNDFRMGALGGYCFERPN